MAVCAETIASKATNGRNSGVLKLYERLVGRLVTVAAHAQPDAAEDGLAAADAAEVRVLERGRVFEAEAGRAIHTDMRDQHGAGEHQWRGNDEEADAHEP